MTILIIVIATQCRLGPRTPRTLPLTPASSRTHGQGKVVVRLKGGDPAVFSRVHSEMEALAAAGIPYELVPGVSSALAAPLCAGECYNAPSTLTLLCPFNR
jgi:precorrin-4 methylase